MTPRDQKVPVPVMVAADHKMAFSPHVARRSARGSLELAATQDTPDVDLRIIPTEQAATTTQSTASTIIVNQVPPVAPVTQEAQTFACTQCPKVFTKKQALLHAHIQDAQKFNFKGKVRVIIRVINLGVADFKD